MLVCQGPTAAACSGHRGRARSDLHASEVFASPVMHPPFVGNTITLVCAFANRTELLHVSFGRVILRPNETRGTREGKMLEQPIPSRSCCFGREALSPKGPVQRIEDMRFWPVERVEDADATEKIAAVDLFTGPVSYTHLTLPTIYSV